MIFGVALTESELFKKAGLNEERIIKGCNHEFDREEHCFCSKCGANAWEVEELDIYCLIEEACEKLGFDHQSGGEDDSFIYLGLNPSGISGQEAIDSMSRMNNSINEIFGVDAKLYSGTYYS